MKKLISVEEAVAKVKDGMTVMIGGFLSNGTPNASKFSMPWSMNCSPTLVLMKTP